MITKIIQFPYNNQSYKNYNVAKEIYKLPVVKSNVLYNGYKDNEHHYTTSYHVNFVLPFLGKLLDFKFNVNDFVLIPNFYNNGSNNFNLSYLKPKNEHKYTITDYTTDITKEYSFDELCNSTDVCGTKYHILYRFYHKLSKIVNNEAKTNKSLFVSCDSQMIPSILPLAEYFHTIYCIDNRTGQIQGRFDYSVTKSLFNNEQINTDYILICLWNNDLEFYTKVNFK